MAAAARPAGAGAAGSRLLQLDGRRTLRVLEAGDGPPVVLIHGALGTAEDMAIALFDQLAPRFRVLAPDRPGHGFSVRERFEASPFRQAELIRAGLAQMGVERPVLAAHSMGGPVALAWARQWPEELAGLLLMNTAAYPELRPFEHFVLSPRAAPGAGPLMSRAAGATLDPLMLPLVQKYMFSPQEVPERWAREFPHDLVRRPEQMTVEGEDFADVPALARLAAGYRATPVRTIILAGERDRVVSPRTHSRALVHALANAELREFPELGHMLHHFAQDAVVEAIEALAA
ncbi:MAG TPA: alpha/beta hydrolase [Caulobacteraceae bacterium]|jgi:pimeloyl-ACP methyl ester carboxylesterase